MRVYIGIVIIVVSGGGLWAPDGAAAPPPEQTVEQLIYANHGLGELASKELLETWNEVRNNPKPYLPALRAWVTWERIEAATDQHQLRGIQGAINLIVLLGGEDERALLVTRLRQLHQKRDELSTWVKSQGRGLAARPESEKAFFKTQVRHMNRLIQVEDAILRSFGEVKDSRLRDPLLQRLTQDSEMRDKYLDYFEATGRKDPLVRAQVKKLLEAPSSEDPLQEQRLRRFLEER